MSTHACDFITYAGPINMIGYQALCAALEKKAANKAVLVLATPGGDPHAGFRIARALQHSYEKFDALVPRYCKSAGTLILIGASTLYLDDMSELGPLDIQVKKSDEVIGRNSGLDIFQAVNFLQNQSMSAFRTYLMELTSNAGLSTKVASEIASKLTSGLFEPIAAQIDPIKLAEMQRATEIAFEYGNRLNEKSGNMRSIGLAKLVTGYPSHSFVIDRKEAKTIFINVKRPEGFLAQASQALRDQMQTDVEGQAPKVHLLTVQIDDHNQEPADDDSPDAQNGAGSAATGDTAIHGDSPCAEAANEPPDSAAPSTEPAPDTAPPAAA